MGTAKMKRMIAEEQDRHGHAEAEVGNQLAEHQTPTAQRTNEQLLEGSAFAFADHGHGGGEGGADLQDDSDDARNEKVRAAHRRVIEHLRPDLDRDMRASTLPHQALDGLAQGDRDGGVERLQGNGGVRPIDQHLHLRGITGADIAGEMRRDLQADIGAALADLARELIDVLHFADHAKGFGVDETIDELTALDGAVLIQDDHGHVAHVVIECVAEGDHLDERREEHEEEGHRIAQDADEFLEEDGVEAAEGRRFHLRVPSFLAVIPSRADGEGPRIG